MNELTLESLAARVAELERKLAEANASTPSKKDWRSVIGMFEDNEFTRQWIAETEAIRESDRRIAREAAGDNE